MGITMYKKDDVILALIESFRDIKSDKIKIPKSIKKIKIKKKKRKNVNKKVVYIPDIIVKKKYSSNEQKMIDEQNKKSMIRARTIKMMDTICNVSREITDGMVCRNGVVLCATDNYYN